MKPIILDSTSTAAHSVEPRADVLVDGTQVKIVLSGDWIARLGNLPPVTAPAMPASLDKMASNSTRLVVDTSGLGTWDSALLVFVSELRQMTEDRGMVFDAAGLPPAANRLLALMPRRHPAPFVLPRATLAFRIGERVLGAARELHEVSAMLGDVILGGGVAIRGRALIRRVDLLDCLRDAGASALPIVIIVNLLMGGILAFVGAVQLRRFGADVYVANLVGIAVVREIAALMTAIIMSGRTGGAYAAHIATMLGNEEIDALRAVGVKLSDYLILPRVVALTVMMPLLYLYGSLAGIFGGFLVAIAMLHLAPLTFIDHVQYAVAGSQIIFGLSKSVAFGLLIALTGCRIGLSAGRSAADVGRAATSAVVAGIVGVIALDAVFAVCANALDF